MPRKPKEKEGNAERKRLLAEANRLYRLTKEEDQNINELTQQREKLNYFWILEKKKVEVKQAELHIKEREVQDLEEKQQVEIKSYHQRSERLLREQQNEIRKNKTEAEIASKVSKNFERGTQTDAKENHYILQKRSKLSDQNQNKLMRALKREHDHEITKLRQDFEVRANEVRTAYDRRMKKNRAVLDRIRKGQVKQVEDKEAEIIDLLMTKHRKAFVDIKKHYQDMMQENLDYIASNRSEMKGLENQEYIEQNKLNEAILENKRLSSPMKQMEDTYNRLKSEKEDYDKERVDMETVKEKLANEEAVLSSRNWDYVTLLQRFEILRNERDELEQNLFASISDIKHRSHSRGVLLEEKLITMQSGIEESGSTLDEVLTRAKLEPDVLAEVKCRFDDALLRKNEEMEYLLKEIARVKLKHQRLASDFDNKISVYGLSATTQGLEGGPDAVPRPGSNVHSSAASGPVEESESVR